MTLQFITCYRRKQLSGGDLPNPMSGSCGVCVEGILYLFGGHHARGNTNLVRLFPQRQHRVPNGWKISTAGAFFQEQNTIG